jgi:hypothetical protein
MTAVCAPGLTGDYLNAWLAALGVTVLVDGALLRWTDDRVPAAVLTSPDGVELVDAVGAALPSVADLDRLAIANLADRRRFPRNVDIEQYRQAAEVARASRDFSLAASVTDLVGSPKDDKLPHSPFDPAAPRGETLWSRLRACRLAVGRAGTPADAVRATLDGTAARVDLNGLGFDFRRIPAGSQSGGPHVDPLLECLAFYGLALLPTRGGGGARAWTRGWTAGSGSHFQWPTWSANLDRWAIDALLGALYGEDASRWRRQGLGVTGVFETIRYQRTGDMDQTAGFASRVVR